MNKIDDERLKPCPFCGEPGAVWYFPQHDRPLLKEAYYVGCTNDNCGCEMEHPGGYKSLDDAVNAWNRRPLEQEPKTGEWIEHFDESGKWYECDQCHTDWGGAVNFCPNCGADMREVEE